jgi:hypothetical protein
VHRSPRAAHHPLPGILPLPPFPSGILETKFDVFLC